MSRRAIISDIHSNLLALEAVLADIQQQKVDAIVCLGDICGYGPEPIQCVDKVRAVAQWTLMGNHDEALFVEPRDFGKNARLAIEWQKSVLEPKMDASQADEERWYWLHNLVPRRAEKNVLFVHASPREPLYEYVLKEDFADSGLGPPEKAVEIFRSMDWLCFCGHSHRPGVVAEDFHWYRPEELGNYMHVLKPGCKTLINVGSVGQPRDGITWACYCLLDLPEPPDLTKTMRLTPSAEGAPVSEDAPTMAAPVPSGDLLASRGLSEVGIMEIGEEDKTPTSEELTKSAKLARERASSRSGTQAGSDAVAAQDATRTSQELQQARETALLNLPRVTFRRVSYDVAAAQARFRAVPQLPESLALRLARGL
jgi:hypothetical protein